jgi:23S rRNA (guanosine2251-2'-O)-methyltransferase
MKTLAGFHAVKGRLKQKADSVREIYVDAGRSDGRMKELKSLAEKLGVRLMAVDTKRLDGMAGGARHQGVVAMADEMRMPQFIEDVLETLDEPPFLLLLDGVQDPHNLGACLRVADGAGAHAVIAPKDRSCGLTIAASKVASGAAETVPYIVVTNLARTMRDLKERGIWMVGTADDAPKTLWQAKLDGRHLRPPRLHSHDGVGGEPERFRGERCLSLRSPEAAQQVAPAPILIRLLFLI